MAKVSTYLNFKSETEAAFQFYKTVFQSDFAGGGFMRFGDTPPEEGAPALSESTKNLIMHVQLPILDGAHDLMGSDVPEEMGLKVKTGNNVYIMLQPDTRAETQRLFRALAEGGEVEMELADMFWGDYFGSLKDKFGVLWMFNCEEKA